MSETPRIALKNLKKAFGPKQVLNGVDLTVETGESLVIIGGSGTGKSVTLKCLLGLMTPDSGDILIDGQSVLSVSKKERDSINDRVGMLFQNAALFDSMSVAENVAFPLTKSKLSKSEKDEIILEKLAMVGLEKSILHFMPASLSGGMRKRVGLARALAGEPDIILFDEPTTGLDPIMGHLIDDLIVHSVKETGATAVTITHDIASARRIADRVAMLYQGKVIWSGTIAEMDRADNPYLRQFITGAIEGPITDERPV